MTAEEKIRTLGLELPPAPPRGGIYRPLVVVDNLAYLSGHGPYTANGAYLTGRLGEDLTLEEGQEAARQVGLALLATIRAELGSLNRVKRVIKTLALVNSAPGFTQQPQTVNGFSELFQEVFGEDGVGARSALGTNVLPGNIPVEIEVILELHPSQN